MKSRPDNVIPGKLKFKKKTPEKAAPPKIQMPSEVKTRAELAFERAHRDRESQRINEHLRTSHKERMEGYNKMLGRLPEHFDLPKSSSG